METFPMLLANCAGNSPVPFEMFLSEVTQTEHMFPVLGLILLLLFLYFISHTNNFSDYVTTSLHITHSGPCKNGKSFSADNILNAFSWRKTFDLQMKFVWNMFIVV